MSPACSSRSTATRSPIAPTTRSRRGVRRQRRRRLRELPAAALGRRAARRRCSSAGTRSRRRPTATRRCLPISRVASSRTRSSSNSRGCPRSARRSASRSARPAATRPTTSWPPRRSAWPGAVLVATSDRDAYQLVNDRVSILQPVKGVSELARIDEAGVRERYGVEPEQVPDFIALRGDPVRQDPGRPGRRPEEGGRRAEATRLARAGARRRPLPADRRRPAALPEHRDDGRRRAAAEAHADAADLGARRRARPRARAEHPRRQARGARR